MTDNSKTASKAPAQIAYHVRERKGKKGVWTRIGAMWPHSDGLGSNIQLDVAPLDGRITLRVVSDKKD